MARFAVVLFLSLVAAGQTRAASITNTDSAAVMIVLTEGGNKMQLVLDPGASETFCRSAASSPRLTVIGSVSMAAKQSTSSRDPPS